MLSRQFATKETICDHFTECLFRLSGEGKEKRNRVESKAKKLHLILMLQDGTEEIKGETQTDTNTNCDIEQSLDALDLLKS